MNKRLFLSCVLALASSSVLALGIENANTDARASSTANTTDKTSRQSADIDLSALVSSTLSEFVYDANYVRRTFNHGWAPVLITQERLNGDANAYFAKRLDELRRGTPVAQVAAAKLEGVHNQELLTDFLLREGIALAVQAAHAPHYPGFAETTHTPYRQVVDSAFFNSFQPALFYHAVLANKVETRLAKAMQGWPAMSIAERKVRLIKEFLSIPLAEISFDFDDSVRGDLRSSGVGTPYQVQFGNEIFVATDRGITVYGQGGVLFGNGTVNGVRFSYADSAAGSSTTSRSRTITGTTSTRNVTKK